MAAVADRADTLDAVLAEIDRGLEASLERLSQFLTIPSIATDPAFHADTRRAADWLVALLEGLGLRAEARETAGQPVVLAHGDAPAGPRVLFYGHYDVQPVDPLSLWDADPFTPQVITRADGSRMIVARGACDDKGQLMTFLEAVRAIKAVTGALPVPLTVMIEGEEESGSPSLPAFLDAAKDELAADAVFICDTTMWDADTPAVAVSLRGLTTLEVAIHAADRDLHSGQFGGAAQNPNRVLARIIADLHDDQGRVQIPGFYDGVPKVDAETKAMWDGLGMDAHAYLSGVGLSEPAGETGYTLPEQVWARPTCEVNGMSGGYTGAGFKTVIPAEARAKISFRLVGDQDPERLADALEAFVNERLPADCKAHFVRHGVGRAQSIDPHWPMLKVAEAALGDEWGKPALRVGMGGSIPVVADFKSRLGLDSLMVGFSLKDDNVHSPNEKYDVRCFNQGARSWARILMAL